MKKVIMGLFFLAFLVSFSDSGFEPGEPKYRVKLMYGNGYKSTLQNLVLDRDYNRDPAGTSLVGLSGEKYLRADIWNGALDISAQVGLIYHLENNYQDDFFQYNAGVKFTWKKFPWSKYVRTKVYVLEGLSYANQIPYLEKENLDFEDKSHSNFLNYLEFGIAVNLRDITRIEPLDDFYGGVGISHRSGIFGLINGVHGGSNYVTFYLEKEFK
ncbi:MAG: hypothetical protein LBV03_08235 [Fusobacteriales bacterium]|jgi:outer membrane protein|nr:hypothetical protein [Fusobacteriales bacterium]